MLENIKSTYFFKTIFSYIEEKTKLKIIKCNKNLQQKLKINIINYKFLSQRFIIYETKSKVKEYNYDGELIYEGEYLNGKRSGKGNEFFLDELVFEGEYLNGKRNGKGKIYENGKLIFEGEYIKGKLINDNFDKNGKIITKCKDGEITQIYDFRGKLIFEGEFLNGEKNGKGKEYNNYGKLIFEGEYKNNKRNGIGKRYYKEQLIFEGIYINGKRNGKGKEYDNNGSLIFEGEYLNDNRWSGKGCKWIR